MEFIWLVSPSSPGSYLPRSWKNVVAVSPGESLAPLLLNPPHALIVESLGLSDADFVFSAIESARDDAPVWVYEPNATVASSLRWIKAGASHVSTDPDELESLMESLASSSGEKREAFGSLIGRSRATRKVEADIAQVANHRCNLLIEGETGTGKEVVARQTHATSSRSKGPWVAVNCSAIPEALLEAELFGHVKGAFTGAVQARAGKFEVANHGTIFLDEIGDMPLATQAKLLRVLQEREIERLGGNERVRLDVRVIAATNVNLAERVREGTFRQDLYYRLNVFRIALSPLRERPEDIPVLARHFVDKICANERLARKTLDRSTIEALAAHSWPGNVRELENAVETAVIVSGNRNTIFPCDLRLGHGDKRNILPEMTPPISLPAEGLDYQKALEEFEKSLLTQALSRTRGNKTAAADLLGLKRTTLAAKMRVLDTRLPRLVA